MQKSSNRLRHIATAPAMNPLPPHALGILGGIFDPLHNGHLAIAALARDYFGFRKVLFIPAGVPAHKAHTGASPAQRLAMVRCALKGEQGLRVADFEIKRRGTSYTIDSLHTLRELYPKQSFYFIIGSDNLIEIETWHRYKEILSMVTLCVALRPGFPLNIPKVLKNARIVSFPSPLWGISSTQIRDYLAQGYSCRHLLPEGIGRYIIKNKLYAASGCA